MKFLQSITENAKEYLSEGMIKQLGLDNDVLDMLAPVEDFEFGDDDYDDYDPKDAKKIDTAVKKFRSGLMTTSDSVDGLIDWDELVSKIKDVYKTVEVIKYSDNNPGVNYGYFIFFK